MKPVYKPNDELSNSENKLITIPEPCHENWNQMTPKEKGRHCDSCDKVVVDFTKSSKDEIVSHLESSSGKTCGRFRSDQIHMPNSIPSKLSKIAASILAIVGANNAVHSQVDFSIMGDVAIEPIEITVANSISKDISGKISDDENNPIKNAKISVYSGGNLIKSVLTDEEGNYAIDLLPGTIVNNLVVVKVHATDFSSKTLDHLTLKKASTTLNITLSSKSIKTLHNQIEIMGGARIMETQTRALKGMVKLTKEVESKKDPSECQSQQDTEQLQKENANKLTNGNTDLTINEEKQLRALSFSVYPNPTTDLVKVTLSSSGEYDYFVTDIIGNVVYEGFFIGSRIEFSFRNQNSGVYLFNVRENGNTINTTRIVVEK